jgi:hypothetical protein
MSTTPHAVTPVDGRQLGVPALVALLLLTAVTYVVAFDQGWLAALATDRLLESGGVLHEFFHDARHLLGVPCH